MESNRIKIRRFVIFVLLLSVLAIALAWKELPNNSFQIYFFDVGQGDSIFIKTPENYQILVDGGPKTEVLTELSRVMPFSDRSIDLVVLTHPHADHIAGLVEVLKKYKVERVMLTGAVYDNAYYEEFLRLIQELKIPVVLAESTKDFMYGTTLIDTIFPFKAMLGESLENVNNSSIVIRVLYEDKVILLTGDAEKEVESLLVANSTSLKADILKVGHHGSKTSSTVEFLKLVRPEIAVIQCGAENLYGHPNEETLINLENAGVKMILRNDLDGTIELSF